MSELIQPLLVFRGYNGETAVVPLQVDLDRVAAETEAAFLIETDAMLAGFASESHMIAVLMVPVDGVDSAVEALFNGHQVHSLDCNCDVHPERTPEPLSAEEFDAMFAEWLRTERDERDA